MALVLNSDRQTILVGKQVINFDDLTSGVATLAMKLPGGARVLAGSLGVTTAFDSVTSDDVVIGDSTTANKYLTTTSAQSTGLTAFTGTDGEADTLDGIYVTLTSAGGGLSAGSMFVEVQYVIDGRGTESQP
jgi:hypothetical protein